MASRWEYRPAGFEDESDDEFAVSGDLMGNLSHSHDAFHLQSDANNVREISSANWTNATQTNELTNSTVLKPEVPKVNYKSRADPVIKICGKSFSFILLDDLRRAAIRNDVHALDALLKAGVDIESRLSSGWTVLMHAVNMANVDAVRFLLHHDANANEDKDGLSVLMVACGSVSINHDDLLTCVNMLLDRDVEINAYNHSHRSPLILAARSGHAAIVQRLIEKGAEVNVQDRSGYTALMHAAARGHACVVQTLLAAKVDVKKVTADGETAADLAFQRGHKKLQQMLDNHLKGQDHGDVLLDPEEQDLAKDELGQGDHWSHPKKTEETCYTFSDLDMFLSGLGLSELSQIFQKENITFEKFLRLKDENLMEMGIHQLSIRKKILDALKEAHKRNWETSSLIPIDYNKKLTCLDAAGMIANVRFHATYIASTIGYLSDQVSAADAKASDKEAEDLCINAEETMANVKHVYKELRLLKHRLDRICRHQDFSPPDLVKPVRPSSRFTRRRVVMATAALSCVLLVVWFHHRTVASVASRYFYGVVKPGTASVIES